MADDKKVYLIYCDALDIYKIGLSKNPVKRLKTLQTGCPYPIVIKSIFQTDYPYKLETSLHRKFSSKKVDENEYSLKGEWFSLSFEDARKFQSSCELIEENFNVLKNAGNPFV